MDPNMKKLESYCNRFNTEHPGKGILSVIPNTCGCTVNVVLGCRPILMGITKKEAFYAITAITRYEDMQKGDFSYQNIL